MTTLESIVAFCDDLLDTDAVPDYPGAQNGLQVDASPGRQVAHLACAVDASEAVIADAVTRKADLLLVHHGLFWGGASPVTGPLYRKLRLLISNDLALYSSHLPLDGHPGIGNGALLCDALGVGSRTPFGDHEGFSVGWAGEIEPSTPERLAALLEEALAGAPVPHFGSGPAELRRVGVVTGGGGSFIAEAAEAGLDALVTGEGAHHTYAQAHELGVTVFYGGHYATETFGVRALARRLATEFGLQWTFLDHPSGL